MVSTQQHEVEMTSQTTAAGLYLERLRGLVSTFMSDDSSLGGIYFDILAHIRASLVVGTPEEIEELRCFIVDDAKALSVLHDPRVERTLEHIAGHTAIRGPSAAGVGGAVAGHLFVNTP